MFSQPHSLQELSPVSQRSEIWGDQRKLVEATDLAKDMNGFVPKTPSKTAEDFQKCLSLRVVADNKFQGASVVGVMEPAGGPQIGCSWRYQGT